MTVAAVVLAAGGGSRFAGDGHKLTAMLRGKPVVAWAVEHALEAGLDESVAVTGAVDLSGLLPPTVTVLHNPDWERGMATSLTLAVTHADRAGHEAIVVGLGDQPFVEPEAWRLVAASDASPIVAAVYDGRRRNPVRLARSVWALLDSDGDEGARSLMRRRPDLVSGVACPGTPADVDTVEDLTKWS
ncbi:MAG TPA: nucleotidyltransferase family protein [Acidimicrobiales bacterium]